MMMGDNRLNIQDLPDEMLLHVFRALSATDFIATLPMVCERWSRIIASDTCTLRRIGMHHVNEIAAVDFFYFRDECERSQMMHWTADEYERLLRTAAITRRDGHDRHHCPVSYAIAYFLCCRYPQVCGRVGTLVISSSLSLYAVGFTYIDHLTTLVLHGVRIRVANQYTLAELGTVYSNVQDVAYVQCTLATRINLKFLHVGFGRLRRFRAEHHSIGPRFLNDLLHTHRHTLETAVLHGCLITSDRWIEVLSRRLRGRTVNSLSMHSPFFTDSCVNKFLNASDVVLPDDRSAVTIDNEIAEFEFSINIDPL